MGGGVGGVGVKSNEDNLTGRNESRLPPPNKKDKIVMKKKTSSVN